MRLEELKTACYNHIGEREKVTIIVGKAADAASCSRMYVRVTDFKLLELDY